jgi:hypothetical protein
MIIIIGIVMSALNFNVLLYLIPIFVIEIIRLLL